jgi:hypothetical protein
MLSDVGEVVKTISLQENKNIKDFQISMQIKFLSPA